MRITADSCVSDVLDGAPETIRVFIDFRMNCVGCPIASFHSIAHASAEHGIELETLLDRLNAAVGGPVSVPDLRPA